MAPLPKTASTTQYVSRSDRHLSHTGNLTLTPSLYPQTLILNQRNSIFPCGDERNVPSLILMVSLLFSHTPPSIGGEATEHVTKHSTVHM